jgi:hypothetical protein
MGMSRLAGVRALSRWFVVRWRNFPTPRRLDWRAALEAEWC